MSSVFPLLTVVKEIRLMSAPARIVNAGRRTILFVDEVHRFLIKKFATPLPHIEDGTHAFIGALNYGKILLSLNSALGCRVSAGPSAGNR